MKNLHNINQNYVPEIFLSHLSGLEIQTGMPVQTWEGNWKRVHLLYQQRPRVQIPNRMKATGEFFALIALYLLQEEILKFKILRAHYKKKGMKILQILHLPLLKHSPTKERRIKLCLEFYVRLRLAVVEMQL